MKNSKILIWVKQVRAPFLILSVVLVLIGVGFAYQEGYSNLLHTVLLLAGVISAHISVNLFNEYSDFKTGIDSHTTPTPFSGGSGMLLKSATTSKQVKTGAYAALIISCLIGLYFSLISGWLIIFFMLTGALAIRFYTSHLSHFLLGELSAGLTLGTFVVLGSFYVLSGYLNAVIIWISIPAGILTFLLLFLNEFPDLKADKKGGRHHLVIHFGTKTSSTIYLIGILITFSMILLAPILFNLSFLFLISLLTIPLAIKSTIVTKKYHNHNEKLLPALGLNVGVIILTDLLMAVGGFVS
ncbi:MAG: prenyltransferase [bacterium]